MPGTLEDFINSFTGGGNPDAQEAEQLHERFVSTHENDRDFDNQAYHEGAAEYLQKLPDDEFHQAAKNMVAQAPPQQRADLLGGLLNALGGAAGGGANNPSGGVGGLADVIGGLAGGGGLGGLAQMLGLGSTDPKNMSEDDAAKLMNHARKENPEALRQIVQEKPWFVKAMGNPVVMGALTMAAAKLLSNRRR
jgi:hypothetical protein